MPPVRRSTRKSAGKSPAKYVPEEEAPVGLPVEEEESEDDEEYEAEEDAPSMHFGLASRAALEAEEGGVAPPAVNIFLINALIEGLAGVTALYESFQPEGERMLVADTSSPMLLRMWGGAIVGLAATSYLMSLEDSSRARSAFCLGTCVYHAAAASIILHLFFTAESTALPGAGLVKALVTTLGQSVDDVVQRKACASAAVLVHSYLGFGLYKSSQETTDEVLVVWEDDDSDDDDDDA